MAAWMQVAAPGEEHEYLKRLIGTWKAKTKFWMDPDGPPQESEGTMICNYTNPFGKPDIMKGVTAMVSADEHKYESWAHTPDGKTFKNMEILYTR